MANADRKPRTRRRTRASHVPRPTRLLRIIGQTPSFLDSKGRIVTDSVPVPAEVLSPGPRGYRVCVVDFDASKGTYRPAAAVPRGQANDRYLDANDSVLLSDPGFHAQNAYAIVMRTLARFEFALGRRVSWGFYGHQLQVAPHGIEDANAFYSEAAHGLTFGHFTGARSGKPVYTCLSHDIVAHETTHAIVDGLRDMYTDAALPDQAAFHEGFADIVALLSIFAIPRVMRASIEKVAKTGRPVNAAWLKESALLGIAEELGSELSPSLGRAEALRRSITIEPDPRLLSDPAYQEPHSRGEILVHPMLNAFVDVWSERVKPFVRSGSVTATRLWEEAAEAADHLLTMSIRALDYCPPLDLTFGDYLSALLTSDMVLVPDDSKYGYRDRLRKHFGAWGIAPSSKGGLETGAWQGPHHGLRRGQAISTERVHFDSLRTDPDEVFRFLWENRSALRVYDDAYTRVTSLRPCKRVGPDGFVLHETVAEYYQKIDCTANDLRSLGLKQPPDMDGHQQVTLFGGGTLIFDEFGTLRYHVRKRIDNLKHQQEKLEYLWTHRLIDRFGRLGSASVLAGDERFARLHQARMGASLSRGAEW